MSFPMFRRKSFSEAAGGGDITAGTGTVPDIMTGDGAITAAIHRGIKKYPLTGGIVTAISIGAGVPGIRILFTTARKVIRPVGVILPDVLRVIGVAVSLPADILPVGGLAEGRAVALLPAVFTPVADIHPEHR
jgi:hypothetical protein